MHACTHARMHEHPLKVILFILLVHIKVMLKRGPVQGYGMQIPETFQMCRQTFTLKLIQVQIQYKKAMQVCSFTLKLHLQIKCIGFF